MVIPIGTTIKMEDAASDKGGRRSRLPNGDLLDLWLQKHGNLYPSREQKQRLAEDTQMTVDQVCRWFANRRRNKPYMGRGRRKGNGRRSSGTNTPQSCTSDETNESHLSNNHTGLTYSVKERERRVADSNNNRSQPSMFQPDIEQCSAAGFHHLPPVPMYQKDLLTPPALGHPHFAPPTTQALHSLHNILSNPFLSAYLNPMWALNMSHNFLEPGAQDYGQFGGGGGAFGLSTPNLLSPREISSPSSVSSAAPSVFSPGMHANDGYISARMHEHETTQDASKDCAEMDNATETAVEALLQLSEKESIAVAVLAEFQRQRRKLETFDSISLQQRTTT